MTQGGILNGLAVRGLLLGGALSLGGCTSLLSATSADVAGVASAGIAGGITRNAAVGTGIGLAVAGGAVAGLHYVERRVHRTEQDEIAAAAGRLGVGEVGTWRVVHTLPIEADKHGEVTVFRVVNAPDFTCKEIVFSVQDGHDRPEDFYTTTVCFDGERWKWALAEPATARWGGLQ